MIRVSIQLYRLVELKEIHCSQHIIDIVLATVYFIDGATSYYFSIYSYSLEYPVEIVIKEMPKHRLNFLYHISTTDWLSEPVSRLSKRAPSPRPLQVKSGFVMNIICLSILMFSCNTWIYTYLHFGEYPVWAPNFNDSAVVNATLGPALIANVTGIPY